MNRLEKDLGTGPRLLAQVIPLGFSYASIRDAVSFLGASVTIDQMRRVLAQFRQQLEAIVPPEGVKDPILKVLDRMNGSERQDELIVNWQSLEAAVLGLIQWLHQVA